MTKIEKKFVQSIREGRHKEIEDCLTKAEELKEKARQLSEKYSIPFDYYGGGGYLPVSGKGLDIVLCEGEIYLDNCYQYDEQDLDKIWEEVPKELRDAISQLGYVSFEDTYGDTWEGEWMPSRNC